MILFERDKIVSTEFYRNIPNRFYYPFFFCITEPKQQLMLAFSVYTNGRKIFSCKKSKAPNVMECLDGIRFFSALWVIYAHAHVMVFLGPVSNYAYVPEVNLIYHFLEFYSNKFNSIRFSVGLKLYINGSAACSVSSI